MVGLVAAWAPPTRGALCGSVELGVQRDRRNESHHNSSVRLRHAASGEIHTRRDMRRDPDIGLCSRHRRLLKLRPRATALHRTPGRTKGASFRLRRRGGGDTVTRDLRHGPLCLHWPDDTQTSRVCMPGTDVRSGGWIGWRWRGWQRRRHVRAAPTSVRPDRSRVSDEYERNQLLPPAFALGGERTAPPCGTG